MREKEIIKLMSDLSAPVYMRIRRYIIRRIAAGAVGDKIPSENELCRMFDVTRPTVRLAISDLLDKGLLIARKGVGVFVNRDSGYVGRKVIGLVFSDGHLIHYDYNYIGQMIGAMKSLMPENCLIVNLNLMDNQNAAREALSLRLDGIVWFSPEWKRLVEMAASKLPVVAVSNTVGMPENSRLSDLPETIGSVLLDYQDEGRKVAGRFLEAGFTEMIYAAAVFPDDAGAIIRGMESVFRESGISGAKVRMMAGNNPAPVIALMKKGFRAVYPHYLSLPSVHDWASRRHLKFKKDYYLVARSNCRLFAEHKNIPFDEIVYPLEKTGATAGKMLLEMMAGKKGCHVKIKSFIKEWIETK